MGEVSDADAPAHNPNEEFGKCASGPTARFWGAWKGVLTVFILFALVLALIILYVNYKYKECVCSRNGRESLERQVRSSYLIRVDSEGSEPKVSTMRNSYTFDAEGAHQIHNAAARQAQQDIDNFFDANL